MPEWICAYSDGTLRPCHKPAVWIIERDGLSIGACHRHREALIEQLTPKIRIRHIPTLQEAK